MTNPPQSPPSSHPTALYSFAAGCLAMALYSYLTHHRPLLTISTSTDGEKKKHTNQIQTAANANAKQKPLRSPARKGSTSNLDLDLDSTFTPLVGAIRESVKEIEDKNNDNNKNSAAPILIVGIAGGSGSGKTTLAEAIFTALGGSPSVTFISHDSYYKDLSTYTHEERAMQNFDHPFSLDTKLLIEHLEVLKEGGKVGVPVYDFSTHTRREEVTVVQSRRVIIVEGILIFTEPALCAHLNIKIFVDTESDLRLLRRITRDCSERLRSLPSVLEQYTRTVRPMHIEFVEPSKRMADIIVPVGINEVALNLITDHLRNRLEDYSGVEGGRKVGE